MKKMMAAAVLLALLAGCTNTAAPSAQNSENIPTPEPLSNVVAEPSEEGPYGKISLQIPSGWCCEDYVPEGFDSVYGLCVFPDGSDAHVEIRLGTFTGVCGTGLKEEIRTIAGMDAHVGYWDGNEDWGYIRMGDPEDQAVVSAWSFGIMDWTEQQKTEFLQILNTLTYEPDEQSGAIGCAGAESEISELSVIPWLMYVSSTNGVLDIRQTDNRIADDITFYGVVGMEKKNGDVYEELNGSMTGFPSEKISIEKESDTHYSVNWTDKYGTLEAGDYRLVLNINNKQVYAYFLVR